MSEWSTAAGRKVRQMAWQRDKAAQARCWICGQPIDYSIKPSTTADSWEPDHVLPRSRHPELELDLTNLRASHMACNRSRKDGATLQGLGNRSRVW